MILSLISHFREKKRDNSIPTRGRREPICSLGKIQEVAEEVPDAWHRFEDPDGHGVSCFK